MLRLTEIYTFSPTKKSDQIQPGSAFLFSITPLTLSLGVLYCLDKNRNGAEEMTEIIQPTDQQPTDHSTEQSTRGTRKKKKENRATPATTSELKTKPLIQVEGWDYRQKRNEMNQKKTQFLFYSILVYPLPVWNSRKKSGVIIFFFFSRAPLNQPPHTPTQPSNKPVRHLTIHTTLSASLPPSVPDFLSPLAILEVTRRGSWPTWRLATQRRLEPTGKGLCPPPPAAQPSRFPVR